MSKFFKTKLGKLFLIGLLIKLIIAPVTYHSDIAALDFAGQVISGGNITNFYDYLPNLNDSDPILKVFPANLFNYPPLVYFFISTCSLIFTFFIDQNFHLTFLFNTARSFQNPLIFLHLLLLKMPYFIFDVAVFWLLLKAFKDSKEKTLIAILWWFNPVNLYASYMMGQFDLIPVFFSIASLYFVSKSNISSKNLYLSAAMLGLGGAFKIYPLFFLVPLMSITRSWKERIMVGIIGIGTYLLPILPFIGSHGFRSTALVANQTLKSLYAAIPVSGGESIQLFTALLIFLYLFFLLRITTAENLWKRYLLVLFIFFSFTHYHPQWLLWLTPFLIIDLGLQKSHSVILVLSILFCWLGGIFLFEQGLNIGLFVPLNPALYDGKTIWQLLGLNVDINFLRSVLQSVFVGTGLVYFVRYLPQVEVRN